MKKHSAHSTLYLSLLAAVCLLVSACNDRRDPVKPSVGPTASVAAGQAAASRLPS